MTRPAMAEGWRTRVVVAASTLAVGKAEVDGANDGFLVRWCQRMTGNAPPDFWCMSAVCRAVWSALRKASPLLSTGSCEQQRQHAKKQGALRTRAQFDNARAHDPLSVAGWAFLCVDNNHAHHTGIVGIVGDDGVIVTRGPRGGFLTAEGNSADPTKPASRNGDGFYRGRERGHPDDRTLYEFIDLAGFPS